MPTRWVIPGLSGIKGTDSSYNRTPLSFSSLHQCFQFGAFLYTVLAVFPPPLFTEFSLFSPLCIPKLWDSTVSIRTSNSVVRTYSTTSPLCHFLSTLLAADLRAFSHCGDFTLGFIFTLAAWIHSQMEKKIKDTFLSNDNWLSVWLCGHQLSSSEQVRL